LPWVVDRMKPTNYNRVRQGLGTDRLRFLVSWEIIYSAALAVASIVTDVVYRLLMGAWDPTNRVTVRVHVNPICRLAV